MRKVLLLWHGDEPIGICIFAAPAASLALRSRFFGLHGARGRLAMQAMNRQVWVLARLVLHPTWRGAGIAAAFVSRACELCPVPWIETLSALGRVHPVFERAGFVRVGEVRPSGGSAYLGRAKDRAASRFSRPAYFVRDNRPPRE